MHLEYFHLIDRIAAIDTAARSITVDANVPQTSTIFEGHFPGHPLMPGVLLIEAMAQTSGWLLCAMLDFQRMPFLAAVKEAKMRTFVTPGTALRIDANVTHEGSGYAMADAHIRVGGKIVTSATLTFRHAPFPNADMRGHMEATARKVGMPGRLMAQMSERVTHD